MLEIRINVAGASVRKMLEGIALRAKDTQSLHAIAGHKYLFEELPRVFRAHGPGWQAPKRRIGSPLQDTGRLQSSWAYQAFAAGVKVGTQVRYATTHQLGRVIRPRNKKFLLIPLSPPLTSTEARAWPIGKDAIKARYPGSFFLVKGPDGPGIYVPTKGKAGWHVKTYKSGHRVKGAIGYMTGKHNGQTIKRIAAAVRIAKVEKREIVHPRPSAEYQASIANAMGKWITNHIGAIPPAAAGTPDVGPRKGQLQ